MENINTCLADAKEIDYLISVVLTYRQPQA